YATGITLIVPVNRCVRCRECDSRLQTSQLSGSSPAAAISIFSFLVERLPFFIGPHSCDDSQFAWNPSYIDSILHAPGYAFSRLHQHRSDVLWNDDTWDNHPQRMRKCTNERSSFCRASLSCYAHLIQNVFGNLCRLLLSGHIHLSRLVLSCQSIGRPQPFA